MLSQVMLRFDTSQHFTVTHMLKKTIFQNLWLILSELYGSAGELYAAGCRYSEDKYIMISQVTLHWQQQKISQHLNS